MKEVNESMPGFEPTADGIKDVYNYAIEDSDLDAMLPVFLGDVSKNDFGRVAIVAGSARYPGAAALCANAAVRAGAGVVYLYSTAFHASLLPEVIQVHMPATDDGGISDEHFEQVLESLSLKTAIAIGPGLGTNSATMRFCDRLINGTEIEEWNSDYQKFRTRPLIVDADALRVVTGDRYYKNSKIVITPHINEFSRMTGIHQDYIDYTHADKFAKQTGTVVHLKGKPSITTDGERRIWNNHGNSGLSTGGSGDVLTGITVAYLGFGIEHFEAAALASYAHTKTAELYAAKYKRTLAFTPSDIIEYLRYI